MPSKEQQGSAAQGSLSRSEQNGRGHQIEHNGRDEQSQSADIGKGKGKEGLSVVDRLQASGSTLLKSTLLDKDIPTMPTGQKGEGASSSSTYSLKHHSDLYAKPSNQGNLQGHTRQTVRRAPCPESSTNDFESFGMAQVPTQVISADSQFGAPSTSRSVSEQEALDGSAVVDLLSKPESTDDPLLYEEEENLSPDEAKRLRQALFDAGSAAPFWDSVLNFSPAFISNSDVSGEHLTMLMGTPDREEARRIWLKQWNDVLSSYTDEVWGDLSRLVEQAREEVNQEGDESNSSRGESNALERLRQILAHVRGHS